MFQVALSLDNTNPIPALLFAHRCPTIQYPFKVQLKCHLFHKISQPSFSNRISSSCTQPTSDTYVTVILFILDI